MTTRRTSAALALFAAATGAYAQALAPVPQEGERVVPALPAGPTYVVPAPAPPPVSRYVPALPPQGYAPAPRVLVPVPPPPARYVEAVPAVPMAPVLLQQALTLGEAKAALPGLRPGRHEVHFIHPATNRPVCVPLKLSGCVYDVRQHMFFGQHRLVLKVRGLFNDVVVKFKKDGTVAVEG